MRVDYGTRRTIVISSPELAKEIMMKHDLEFSGRFTPFVLEALNQHEFAMAVLPMGDKWRQLRRICKEHIFTPQKVQATEGLRQDKLRQLRDYLEECSNSGTSVDIDKAMMVTSLNMLSNTLVSMDFAGYSSAANQEIRDTIEQAAHIGTTANPADYLPFLRMFDPKGLQRRARACYVKLLAYLEDIVGKRMKQQLNHQSNDLLQVLLDLHQQNELTLEEVTRLLLDLVLDGGESISFILLWIMAELLRDPKIMARVKNELRETVGEEREVVESDIPKLSYLNAMIKETFRFRNGAPFLVARKAEADVEISGYTIPKGTSVLINIKSITRDPKVWPNPDTFDPERFLHNNIDYRGQSFELTPFGSGRRVCPGIPIAHPTLHLIVAHMVNSFDWKLMDEMPPNMDDHDCGLVIRLVNPLKAIPIKNK
uniref:Cytochrome P450 76BV1 n=1 Tax=Ajuga reptans TaxID=38596 RepID=A0A9Y1LQE8_AJURE|nr:cytochrome P450 76BV1 [Ajuga reptans]